MSATARTKSDATRLLAGLSVLPDDKYAWGRRQGLNPAETDRVWSDAMRRRSELKPAA